MTEPANAAELTLYIKKDSPYDPATKADYVRVVARLPSLMGYARLQDVIIDLKELQKRFPLDGFDPASFKSEAAYKAWRRKVLGATKSFSGHARPALFEDEWTKLNRAIELFSVDHHDFRISTAMRLVGITAVARLHGMPPQKLDDAYLVKVFENVPRARYKDLRTGVDLINRLQEEAPSLRALLPCKRLTIPDQATRVGVHIPETHLVAEWDAWVAEFCVGVVDEISGETLEDLSDETKSGYRAAGRKYLGIASSLGLLSDIADLTEALKDDIALPTVRELLSNRDGPGNISLRSARGYIDNILRVAKSQGHEVPVFARALASNRDLKQGRKAAQQMSPCSKKFCIWLLRNRAAEMTYRSLHLQFRAKYHDLKARGEAGERIPDLEARLRQTASLSAMAAIWVWGPPLRIENTCKLRLYGDAPQIWLPTSNDRNIRITIEAEATKNQRAIHQQVRPGRHRAIETIKWYVNEIRPQLASFEDSIWMFPSPSSADRPISTGSARNWLDRHSAEVGLPMKPHRFRHAAASLYIREHSGAYDHVAKLLDDTPQVVRKYYSWIDEMAVLDEVQTNILQHAGFDDA